MNQTRGFLLTIFSACSFGFIPLFAKISYANGFNPYTFSLFRSIFATIELYILLKIMKVNYSIDKKNWFALFKLSVFGYALTILTLSLSYIYMSTGLATTIHFIYPVVVMVGSTLFYHEKVDRKKIISLGLSLIGIYFLVGRGFSSSTNIIGILLAFISGFFYAYYILFVAHGLFKKMNSYVLVFYISLFNSVTLFLIGLFMGKLEYNFTGQGIISTILVALIANLFGMVAFKSGLKYISAISAAIISTFEPITSLIIGMIIFQEIITLNHITGSIFIIASVLIISFKKKEKILA